MPPNLDELKRRVGEGDVAAQTRLGAMYFFGDGVGQDRKAAARFYRMAADRGDVDCS